MEYKCLNCKYYIELELLPFGLCELHTDKNGENYYVREYEVCTKFKPISSQSMGEMSERKGTQVPD